MKQGTVSVLIGCHSVFHSILVILAWIKLYHTFPTWWQLVCIVLHDIGHWGLDYLDDVDAKRSHWELGARVSGWLLGKRGYLFSAGHDKYSGYPLSPLSKADKYAWHIAPTWWLLSNQIFEPKLRMGYSSMGAVRHFRSRVAENVANGFLHSTHDFYLQRCEGEGDKS